jgi:hypothetical protein
VQLDPAARLFRRESRFKNVARISIHWISGGGGVRNHWLRPELQDPDKVFDPRRLMRFVPEIEPFVPVERPVVFACVGKRRERARLARTLR